MALATEVPQPTAPAAPATAAATFKHPRLISVDALRGFDMFWIICGESVVAALHQMSPSATTTFLANQLDHAEWEGFHFYDLIFPLFVFLMGVSTVFSLTKIIQTEGKAGAVKRIVRRTVLLFILALIYSGGAAKEWPNLRLMGVLNRIALCYFFGGLIFTFCRPKVIAGIAAALLLGYWALLAWVPFPDVRPNPGGTQVITKQNYPHISDLNMDSTTMLHGSYIQGVNLTDYLDQKYLPGYKYDGTYDPEGFLSTLPAIVTGLLGIFAGLLLRNTSVPDAKKVGLLLAFGIAGVVIGFLWGKQFPVIKKIWSSSYVLVAGGYSAILLAAFYFIVDIMKFQWWCKPFIWMGMNSITIYMTSNLLGGGGFIKLAQRLSGGDIKNYFDRHVAQGAGDLLVAVVGMLLAFWFVGFLYRKKVFIRL
jgi:predicted acyltransferase